MLDPCHQEQPTGSKGRLEGAYVQPQSTSYSHGSEVAKASTKHLGTCKRCILTRRRCRDHVVGISANENIDRIVRPNP